jgi:hypothetical protein
VSQPSDYLLDAYCLISRVRSLSIILDDVKVVLLQRDLTNKQRKELVDIFVGCYNVLNTLKETLDKYKELDSNSKGYNPKSFSFKVRRGWKRLRWEPDNVKELWSCIALSISLLDAFNGRLTKYFSSPLLLGERN